MQHELLTLKNKLQTLWIDSPGATSGSVQIWFRAGSALEKKEDHGIAHFLEHMFFKGTAKRPGHKIAHDIETFGGDVNAFTSFDYTCYYINTPAPNLKESIEILMDMVSNPLFGESDIPSERDVVFEEYRRSLDNPNQYGFMRMQETCFAGGYAHPILGTPETIKKFSRKQLLNFRKEHYNLSNALLVIAGDFYGPHTKNKLIPLIEKFKIPQGPASEFPFFKLNEKEQIDLHQKDVRMAQLTLALQAPLWSSDEAAIEDLALNCLGYGEMSPLHKSLILDGSTANAVSSSTMFMNKGGFHYLKILFPYAHMNKVLSKTLKVLEGAYKEGFKDEELQKIKNQYIATKVYDKESIESYSFALGHSFAQTGDIAAEEKFLERVKKAELFKVNEALRHVLKRNLQISLQVGKEDSMPKAKKAIAQFKKDFKKISVASKADPRLKKAIKIKQDPQVRELLLKDGVNFIYRQNKMTPTFVLYTYIKAGQVNETQKDAGIHNIMSALLSKGNAKRNFEEIKKITEDKSAGFSGFSGKNAYGLSLHAQSAHSKELFELFMETLLTPTFPEDHFAIERNLIERTLDNQKEDPIKQCLNLVSNIVFHNHPYAMNILGNKEALENFTTEKLKNLHHDHLNKREIVISYCGDLEMDEVLDMLEPYLNKIKPRKVPKKDKNPTKGKFGEHAYMKFDREQTHMFVGMPIPPSGSPEHLYLKMITAHLSGQSSELFVEVRDRQGLCYSAQPIHFIGFEGGYWGIYMASGAEKVPQAMKAIHNLLNKVKNHGLSKEEFLRVKSMIQGQNLLNIQTNDDYSNIYSLPALQHQGLDFYYRTNKAISQMSHEDFQKNIKKLFSVKWNEVLVGKGDS